MVVLSVGIQVPESSADLARRLDVDLDEYNFARHRPFAPVETSRPGVYACGVFQGPKDIPSSVMEASAAACLAGGKLPRPGIHRTGDSLIFRRNRCDNEEPRIGVFVCNCGINIAGVVDVPAAGTTPKPAPCGLRRREPVHLQPGFPGRMKERHSGTPAEPGGGGRLHAKNP